MTKLKLGTLDPRALTSGRGGIYIRDTKNGVVAQSKPKKPKNGWTNAQIANRKRFGLAAINAADAWWSDLATAIEMAKGTDQVPRDILTMAALGRYYEIVSPTGEEFQPMTDPVGPNPEGTPEAMWQWSMYDAAWNAATSTSLFAFKGVALLSIEAKNVTGIRAIFNSVAGGQYKAIIAQISSTGVIQNLVSSDTLTTGGSAQALFNFSISSAFAANTRYAIMVGRTNGANNYALPIYAPANQRWLWPAMPLAFARLANAAPAIGQTIDITTQASIPLGIYFPE